MPVSTSPTSPTMSTSSTNKSFRSRIARRTSSGLASSRPGTPTSEGARSSSFEPRTSTPSPTLPPSRSSTPTADPPAAKESPAKSIRARLGGVIRRSSSSTSLDASQGPESDVKLKRSDTPTAESDGPSAYPASTVGRNKTFRARMGVAMRRTSSIVSTSASRPSTPPPASADERRRSSTSLSGEARKSTASLISILAPADEPAPREQPQAIPNAPMPNIPAQIQQQQQPQPLPPSITNGTNERRSVKRLLPVVAQYQNQMHPSPIAESPLREAEELQPAPAPTQEVPQKLPVEPPVAESEPTVAVANDEQGGAKDEDKSALLLVEAQSQLHPAVPLLALPVREDLWVEALPEQAPPAPKIEVVEEVQRVDVPPLVLDSTYTTEPEESIGVAPALAPVDVAEREVESSERELAPLEPQVVVEKEQKEELTVPSPLIPGTYTEEPGGERELTPSEPQTVVEKEQEVEELTVPPSLIPGAYTEEPGEMPPPVLASEPGSAAADAGVVPDAEEPWVEVSLPLMLANGEPERHARESEETIVPAPTKDPSTSTVPREVFIPPAEASRVTPSSAADDDAYFAFILGQPERARAAADQTAVNADEEEERTYDTEPPSQVVYTSAKRERDLSPTRKSTDSDRKSVLVFAPAVVDPLTGPLPAPAEASQVPPEASQSPPIPGSASSAPGIGQDQKGAHQPEKPAGYPPQGPPRKEDDPMWVLNALVAFVTELMGRFWGYYS